MEIERKELILKAAERLLARHGWQKTTVAGIAKEAHVAVGSVYLEFNSKTLIIHELSRAKYAYILRKMRRAALSQGGYPERFTQMLNARTEGFLEILDTSSHGHDLLHSHCEGVHQAREFFIQAQRELLADFLGAAQDDEVFAFDSLAQTTQAILLAYSHFTPPTLFGIPREHVKPSLMAMHNLVISGLKQK